MCELFKAIREGISLTMIKDLADFLLKAANIYLVYWIFRRNFSERRNERVRDVSRDSLKFMIQEVVLKPNMEEISGFFQASVWGLDTLRAAKMKDGATHEEVLKASEVEIAKFKGDMDVLKQRVVFPLKSLSPSFQELQDIICDTEDCFTGHVQSVITSASTGQQPKQAIEQLRERFIGCLLKAQLKCLCSFEPDKANEEPGFFHRLLN
jgi:hypothetical protein